MTKTQLNKVKELLDERVDILNFTDGTDGYEANKVYFNGMIKMLNTCGYDYIVLNNETRIVSL